MSIDIKQCPFCGEDAEPLNWAMELPPDIRETENAWGIRCVNPNCSVCPALGDYYPSLEDAARAWNRREGLAP